MESVQTLLWLVHWARHQLCQRCTLAPKPEHRSTQIALEKKTRVIKDLSKHLPSLEKYLQKWTRVPDDYQELYQQALEEMQQPDFVATHVLTTAWGTRAMSGGVPRIRGLY
jgi:hypothetical protein